MTRFYILMVVLFIISSSCQRSQFSTTTRQYKNGRVTYINNYQKERSKTSKAKSPKKHPAATDEQNPVFIVAGTEGQNFSVPGILNYDNILIANSTDLLAGTSIDPIIYKTKTNQNNSGNHKKNPVDDFFTATDNDSIADTIKSKTPNKNLTFDSSFAHIIKFKTGNTDTVRIISHSDEGLYYQLISGPKKVRFVVMAEIDTVYQLKNYVLPKDMVADTPKNEPLSLIGLISSILGLVPVFGLPFAFLGLFFGYFGLKKIRRSPLRYKGTKIARASIIIGSIGLGITVIFSLAILFSSMLKSCDDVNIHF